MTVGFRVGGLIAVLFFGADPDRACMRVPCLEGHGADEQRHRDHDPQDTKGHPGLHQASGSLAQRRVFPPLLHRTPFRKHRPRATIKKWRFAASDAGRRSRDREAPLKARISPGAAFQVRPAKNRFSVTGAVIGAGGAQQRRDLDIPVMRCASPSTRRMTGP